MRYFLLIFAVVMGQLVLAAQTNEIATNEIATVNQEAYKRSVQESQWVQKVKSHGFDFLIQTFCLVLIILLFYLFQCK